MKRTFRHDEYEFGFLIALGSSYRGAADVGECLSTAGRIKEGNAESWVTQWLATSERTHEVAESCAAEGHRVSARDAFLRAATYYSTALYLIDATKDVSRMLPTWQKHRACWDRFADLVEPPAERLSIPYEDTTLPGYFFKADRSGARRPLLIMNNGSDGPTSSMWGAGGAAALARGYNFMTFDGPGQQSALLLQNLGFRHDWENVITPVVDYLLRRPDVDEQRLAIIGVSQGGYWVPRALAFEHRIAAAVADPGVWDVGAQTWFKDLPKGMRKLLDSDEPKARAKFNRELAMVERFSKALRARLEFRMRPYRLPTAYDVFKAVLQYRLSGVVDRIACPMLITDPEGEQFWPGESQVLYDALRCPKTLIKFTAAEGAGSHCEPAAAGLREQRIFDWLDEALGLSS
ncbi:MAG: prolyl oligopeptidase family serine peptidase [Acidobacteriota bacterium]